MRQIPSKITRLPGLIRPLEYKFGSNDIWLLKYLPKNMALLAYKLWIKKIVKIRFRLFLRRKKEFYSPLRQGGGAKGHVH